MGVGKIETVIYGDVLAAVNFIINLMVLGLTRKLTGVPVKRFRRYMGAFAGAAASFVIFLPVHGMLWDIIIRILVTGLVIGVTYWGQPAKTLLRLSAVFFTVGFILAGFVVGIWFLLPSNFFAFGNSIIYLNITPLTLLGCCTAAYLFVSVFDRIFDRGNNKSCTWQVTVCRNGSAVRLQLFMDTGNHLIEPFSGLPVMVADFNSISPLLTPEERQYILGMSGAAMPSGLRPVFYNGIGAEGLLYAFLPESVLLEREKRSVESEGYMAVSVNKLCCSGCAGIFNPRLLGLGVSAG